MKITRRMQLFVERLEDRFTPTLLLSYYSGSLMIRGTPTDTTTGLHLNGVAGNVQVLDGARNLGSYRVNNLFVLLASHPGDITVDLTALGRPLGGNILIDVGIGNTDATTAYHSVSVFGGTIGGWLTMRGGSGQESLILGDAAGATPLTVGGDVAMTGKKALANGVGDFFALNPGSRVGRDVTITQVENVDVGLTGTPPLATVGRNLTADDTDSPINLLANMRGLVGGNFTVSGSGGAGGLGDAILLSPDGVPGGGVVVGNVQVSLGSRSLPGVRNSFSMDGDGANAAVVTGNVAVTGGGADNAVAIGVAGVADIQGSLSLTMGEGSHTITLGAGGAVNGDMGVTLGNGDNLLAPFTGTVDGNLALRLGNGDNAAAIATAPGGGLTWRSGNGNDSVSVGTGTGSYQLDVVFGNGDDTLTLDTNGPVTGRVDGGGRLTANRFDQFGSDATPATLSPSFSLSNFP